MFIQLCKTFEQAKIEEIQLQSLYMYTKLTRYSRLLLKMNSRK